jgi:NIMA (never in mitosis gene a)-related kinase
MISLHPPFRAEDMEGLYNKVIKGEYPKISSKYSNDLAQMIDLLLQVKPQDRPTCLTILKHPYVQKRIDFFQAESGIELDDIEDENQLLKTIRIPKNILGLGEQLPKANYNIPQKVKKHIKIEAKNRNTSRDLIFKDKDSIFNNNSEILPNINNTRFISQSIEIQNNSNDNISKKEENQDDIEEKQKLLISKKENENKSVSPLNKKISELLSPPTNKSIRTRINGKIKITNSIAQNERKYKDTINNYSNNNKKQNDLKSYLQNIGLGNLYKIYKEKDDGYNKINKTKKYNNYINKNITNKGLPNIYIINNNITNNYNYNGIKTSNHSIEKKNNIRKIRKYY